MVWHELYTSESPPTSEQIEDFVASPLWRELNSYLRQAYKIEPKTEHSGCSMDKGEWKGWNVKYKKSGKSLCALYPKQGYFVALVVVGAKESAEAELLIPLCDEYTQALYSQTKVHMGGRWLAFEVTNNSILRDVKNLIALQIAPRKS